MEQLSIQLIPEQWETPSNRFSHSPLETTWASVHASSRPLTRLWFSSKYYSRSFWTCFFFIPLPSIARDICIVIFDSFLPWNWRIHRCHLYCPNWSHSLFLPSSWYFFFYPRFFIHVVVTSAKVQKGKNDNAKPRKPDRRQKTVYQFACCIAIHSWSLKNRLACSMAAGQPLDCPLHFRSRITYSIYTVSYTHLTLPTIYSV